MKEEGKCISQLFQSGDKDMNSPLQSPYISLNVGSKNLMALPDSILKLMICQ